MTECGFIGLGRMGGAMARRLIEAGHRVVAFDQAESARDALAAQGASITSSARAVADTVPIVFLSLPNPEVVVDTMLGNGGVNAGNRLEVCVDLSTSGPETAIRLAAGLAEDRWDGEFEKGLEDMLDRIAVFVGGEAALRRD